MRRPYLRSLRKERGWRRCEHTIPVCVAPPVAAGRAHPPRLEEETTMKFQKLTPNLVVRDVAASMEFYRSVLGFQPAITVPEQPHMYLARSLPVAWRFSSTTSKL